MRRLIHTFSVIMVSLLIQSGNVSAAPEASTLPDTFPDLGGLESPPPADIGLPPAYPEWPERPTRREFIPPPPAGPYMSSALSDFDAFPVNTGGLRNEPKEQWMPLPFLDADMPWPETPEYARPEPWIPESGEYHFVPEEIVRQLESPAPSQRQEMQRYMPQRRYMPAPPPRPPYYGYY
jgi:hypothetical protein